MHIYSFFTNTFIQQINIWNRRGWLLDSSAYRVPQFASTAAWVRLSADWTTGSPCARVCVRAPTTTRSVAATDGRITAHNGWEE